MDFFIHSANAQAAAPVGAGPGGAFSPLIMMVLFFVVFWFIAIRPQMKRSKDHRAMLAALAKGDEVATNGGLVGRVVDLSDSLLSIEIADKVVVKLQKGAIAAVLPKGTLKAH
jgi:preprotein translocase subunit YajC